ncbi:pyruvate dehydrogenase (acetyl-transferring) E1 component subunit alpha, partial [candidate division KSB1 bacterium]|nr:pyruvate dehydrogenase (acetyl-transferring) E1 component subunit alpha [candidate division KSB1 bacterium]
AQKALAYGFHGILLDGNDVLAMYVVTKQAVDRARRGEGPTLIEAYTYRLANHTTSDNAELYRDNAEVETWKDKDPIKRFKIYLEKKKIWISTTL